MLKINTKDGFLLIEVILYLALFSIIMGGSVSLFYHQLESNQDLSQFSFEAQEVEFILGKIDWLLRDFEEIYEPDIGKTSGTLFLKKGGDEFTLKEENGEILLKKNNEDFVSLNNSQLKVENLTFESMRAFGDPDSPFIVKASFFIGENEFSVSRFNLAQ